MSGTLRAAIPSAPVTGLAAQIERCRRDLRRFAVLALELGLLLLVFELYGLESRRFLTLSSLIVGGFTVPTGYRFALKSLSTLCSPSAGSFLLLDPVVARTADRGRRQYCSRSYEADWPSAGESWPSSRFGMVCAYGRATGRFPSPRTLLGGVRRCLHVPHDHLPL